MLIFSLWTDLISKEYVKSLLKEEVNSAFGIEHNPNKMRSVLKSLARNISTSVANTTLVADVKNNSNDDISRPTLNDYINTLEKLFVIENIPATDLNIRSKRALRTKPKRIFVDPSIASAVLELTPDDLIKDLKYYGFIFENLCIRDLQIYAQKMNGDISFYRDETDFEIDVILRTGNGKWAAIEIKLGAGYVDEGIKNLLKFKDMVDIEKCGEPAFLMVLTGGNYSFKTEEGVYVVSISNLKD